MSKYNIIRIYDAEPSVIVARNLTLAEAQAHCQRDDTHGDGWFDGYDSDTAGQRDLAAEVDAELNWSPQINRLTTESR